MLESLRGRLWAGMAVLIALVVLLFSLAVRTIRSLDRSVDEEVNLLLQTTAIGNNLVSAVTSEIRSAEQYIDQPAASTKADFLRSGDSAYSLQRRYREVGSLTTSDRFIINRIGATQARLEVAYAHAHALTDLGHREDARKLAGETRTGADTLIGDVQALTLAQSNRSLVRANDLKTESEHRRFLLWLIFFLSLAGIPPLPGFFGKYMVFALAIQNGYTYFVILAIVTSLIGVFFYFRIIIAMFFSNAESETVTPTLSIRVLLIVLIALSFAMTVFADSVVRLIA